MELQAILDEFGRSAGLGRVGLNEDGVCRLVFDDELTVDVERVPSRGSFYLHAVVGRLPPGDDPGLLRDLLAANLFGRHTGGATLALDPGLGEILLHRELADGTTDYQAFAAALEGFVNALERSRDRLAQGAPGGTAAPRAANALPMPGLVIRG